MANAQKTENKKVKFYPSRAFWDLVLIIATTIFVLVLSYFFDVFVFIVRFLEQHPRRIIYVDEIVVLLLTLSIGFTVFSWRRWLELKKETAERMKKQDEIIKLTTTQAEVERIISKQLRSDMDQMKYDVREILHLLAKKLK
ncbi:MAG: hypothetical protein PHG69_06715 [Candidatus Omnitrophica bacterium]|nr:hypothetical protein [Candidatus Omnitrophota bacterium]